MAKTHNDTAETTRVELTASQREQAMTRFAVLRPHIDEDVPLSEAARAAGVALRTAQRWLSRYRANGLVGLARSARSDAGSRKLAAELVELIEGMALRKPRPSIAAIHRRIAAVAKERAWPLPSYRMMATIRDHVLLNVSSIMLSTGSR